MNQKGIVPIILLLGFILASAGIVGGSFYVKKNLPTLLNQKQEKVQQIKTTNKPQLLTNGNSATSSTSQSSSATVEKVILPGKIYLIQAVNPGNMDLVQNNLQISDPEYKQVQPFNSLLNQKTSSISKDREKIFDIIISRDQSQTLVHTTPTHYTGKLAGPDDYFYLISEDGGLKEVQSYILGFSTRSNKLIGYNGAIFEYDVNSGQSKTLLSNSSARPIFYDPDQGILVYTEPDSKSDKLFPSGTVKKLNLKDNTTEEISDLRSDIYNNGSQFQNTANYYQFSGLSLLPNANSYFITADKDPELVSNNIGGYDKIFKNRRTLYVKSYYNPKERMAEIKLDEPENITYDWAILWSPDGNYFAIRTHDNETYRKNSKIAIYSRSGRLISKSIVPAGTTLSGCCFSTDNKYFLLNTAVSLSLYTWMIIDVVTGEHLVEDQVIPGLALYWKL